MIFTVTHPKAEPFNIEAASWYQAREWVRANLSTYTAIIAASDGAVATRIAPPWPTAQELAHAHGESLRRAGYEEGVRAAVSAALITGFCSSEVEFAIESLLAVEEVPNGHE